jgi:hypothetical protein
MIAEEKGCCNVLFIDVHLSRVTGKAFAEKYIADPILERIMILTQDAINVFDCPG